MRACVVAAVAVASALGACATLTPTPTVAAQFPVAIAANDASRVAIEADIATARARVEAFFGAPFAEPVHVTVAANRTALDAALPAAWGIAPSQCWMVGVGVADQFFLLSPAVWSDHAQTCDHSGGAEEVQGVITHELTHSFHGQHNATRDFTGMDDLGWFVEGLAVYVSGQSEGPHAGDARAAIAANAAPTALANAWSGRYRYGVSGSMVAYVDAHYGRAKIIELLAATTQQQALASLGVSEAQFLSDWRAWVQGH
jgi:hypothetical protein